MKPETRKFWQGYRQKEAALQDYSHQIPIHQMTVWLCQDHYFSSPSRQVGSKERRLPQNRLRPAARVRKGKTPQQLAHKWMGTMAPSLS